mgnify:CR=1 FL=1
MEGSRRSRRLMARNARQQPSPSLRKFSLSRASLSLSLSLSLFLPLSLSLSLLSLSLSLFPSSSSFPSCPLHLSIFHPCENPNSLACASYACSKSVVAIIVPGIPRRSSSNMSCRLHDGQEPQSAKASTTTSHSSAMVCPTLGAAGLADVSFA